MADDLPPYSYSTPVPQETNILAIISLISALLGWFGVFGLGGLAAVVTGHIAKAQIRDSGGRMGGDGLATAGLVLGYLNIAFGLLLLCLVGLMFAGVFGSVAVCPFILNGGPSY